MTQPVHRPTGGAARFLIIQPNVAGALRDAHIGEQGKDAHAFINGLSNGMADKRIIQRHNTDCVNLFAEAGDCGNHVVNGVNVIMQKHRRLCRTMPGQCRLLKRLRQLMVKRVRLLQQDEPHSQRDRRLTGCQPILRLFERKA